MTNPRAEAACGPPAEPEGVDAAATLAAVLENSVDCVKFLRPDATLEHMNGPGVCAMELPSFEAVRDRVWFDLWPEESREGLRAAFDAAAAGGVGRFEGFCPTAQGTPKWWDVVVTPVAGEGGRPARLLSVSRDVTERVVRGRELEAARRAAADASAAKSAFLANMSHEIRSPLAAILGYCELLEPHGAAEQEKVDVIRRSGRYLQNLVSDVIDLSRIEAGKVMLEAVPFSPAELAEEVLSLLSMKAAEADCRLELHFDGPIPRTVTGDPLRVRQTLVNLVGNALKFTSGGLVDLSLRYEAGAGRLTFEVRDTGVGMSAETLGRVFAAFGQADASTTRKYGGSGLGLTISHELCQLMGGDLTAESREGVGSVFRVRLPLPADSGELVDARQARQGGPSVEAATKLPVRVLVVDDRKDMRFILRSLIERVGGRVESEESGGAALRRLSRDDRFDAVVMDVQMPGMDGLTAVRRLRAGGSALPVIAMTANAMAEDRAACMTAGFTEYLTKPVDFAELVASLRRVTAL